MLALLATSGLLGLTGVVAGGATPGFTSVGHTVTYHITPSESGDYLVAFVEHYIQVQSQFYPPQLYSVIASSNVLLTRAFYG